MTVAITPEITNQLTTDVIHFLREKYPAIDTATATDLLLRGWTGADEGSTIVPIELKRNSPTLERLQDWSDRKGCEIEDAALYALSHYAEDAPFQRSKRTRNLMQKSRPPRPRMEQSAKPEPMPKTFSPEDAFRARGLGISLN